MRQVDAGADGRLRYLADMWSPVSRRYGHWPWRLQRATALNRYAIARCAGPANSSS
jgi:hypothetical protein